MFIIVKLNLTTEYKVGNIFTKTIDFVFTFHKCSPEKFSYYF